MQISEELKNAIEDVWKGNEHANIIDESQKISKMYRENDGKGKRLVSKQSEVLAYAISRMPSTYCAVYSALSQVLKNYNREEIKTVLDIGAGTGAATWAVFNLIEINQVTCLEREKEMRNIGQKLMKSSSLKQVDWKEFDLTQDEINSKTDLIITSYVINELKPEDRRKSILKMWNACNKVLLIIEPGTPEGFKHILESRDILLEKGASIIAPCSHNKKCPINPNEDWCSFYVRVARSGLQRQAKKGELGYEDEKFSYIAFSKNLIITQEQRILRHPIINQGHVKVKLCTKDGIVEKIYSKKDKENYKKIRKLDAGDTI